MVDDLACIYKNPGHIKALRQTWHACAAVPGSGKAKTPKPENIKIVTLCHVKPRHPVVSLRTNIGGTDVISCRDMIAFCDMVSPSPQPAHAT